ncbi:MAG TPA: hypothetical protein VG406_26925 [Isosphaeraceae bacterium]|jgi:hypothetical protein|nr:hypothetical protein [Isosphaeraceae bacterium]
MTRSSWPCRALVLLVLLPLAGCRGSVTPPGPTDEAAARERLIEALDAWREGRKPADLAASASPPIYVADEDWAAGAGLVRFRAEAGPGTAHGPGVRFPVALELRDPAGRNRTKNVVYEVAIDRTVSVARLDMP